MGDGVIPMSLFIGILQWLLVPALSPLVVGTVRKIKARLQNRQGAPIWQPYRQLWKLWHKDEVISTDASWIFRAAPYIVFGVTLVLGATIPVFQQEALLPAAGDFLVIIYLLSLSTFWLALAGLDVGSPFGGLGASREMTMTALTEGSLLFSLLTVALATKTTHISTMIERLPDLAPVTFIPLFIAFIAFCVALLAENKRYPFDNPATHLELTMIHEAMILEYSGKRLALLEWAAANKLIFFLWLGTTLFWPSAGLVIALIKVAVLAAGVALLESSSAKLRYFRLPDVLWMAWLLGVAAVVLLAL